MSAVHAGRSIPVRGASWTYKLEARALPRALCRALYRTPARGAITPNIHPFPDERAWIGTAEQPGSCECKTLLLLPRPIAHARQNGRQVSLVLQCGPLTRSGVACGCPTWGRFWKPYQKAKTPRRRCLVAKWLAASAPRRAVEPFEDARWAGVYSL